jgi:translation initiation factor IF-3
LRPNIEANDLQTKLNNCAKFLDDGDKIKISMQFRGREMSYREAGMEKFRAIIAQIAAMGAIIEADPKLMGNRIIAILASVKKPVKGPAKKDSDSEKSESKEA